MDWFEPKEGRYDAIEEPRPKHRRPAVSERQPIENSSRVNDLHNYSLEGKQIKNHKKQLAKSTRKVKHYISVGDSYDGPKDQSNGGNRSKLVDNVNSYYNVHIDSSIPNINDQRRNVQMKYKNSKYL